MPISYEYFSIFPNGIKLLIDLFLIYFLLEIFIKNKLLEVTAYNRITKYTAVYIIIFSGVFLFSSIINNSHFNLSILEYRKIVFPLIILYIFNYYSILKKSPLDLDSVFKKLFIIQIIVVSFQFLFFPYLQKYIAYPVSHIDSAAGTLGRGTSMIGVLVVIYFIYDFIKTRFSFTSFVYLIPLIFIFSGGANVLFLFGLLLTVSFSMKLSRRIIKPFIGVLLFGLLLVIVSKTLFNANIITSSYNYIVTKVYEKNVVSNSLFTQGEKLSRLKGPVYAVEQLNYYNKNLFGFGSAVYATSTSLNIKSNRFSIGEVINLVPELLLKYGYIGLFVNVLFYAWLIVYYYKRRKNNNYYLIALIIAILNLLNFMYTKPIYQYPYLTFLFYVFYMAEMVGKENYA